MVNLAILNSILSWLNLLIPGLDLFQSPLPVQNMSLCKCWCKYELLNHRRVFLIRIWVLLSVFCIKSFLLVHNTRVCHLQLLVELMDFYSEEAVFLWIATIRNNHAILAVMI